jgi:hypothetical protein
MVRVSSPAPLAAVVALALALGGCADGPVAATASGGASSTGAGGAAPSCDVAAPTAWTTAIAVTPASRGALIDAAFAGVAATAGVAVAARLDGADADVGATHLAAPAAGSLDVLARFDACGAPVWARAIPGIESVLAGTDADAALVVDLLRASPDIDLTTFDAVTSDATASAHVDASCLFDGAPTAGPNGLVILSGAFGDGGKAGVLLEPTLDPSSPSGISCATPTAFGQYLVAIDASGKAAWMRKTAAGGPTTPISEAFAVAADATRVAISTTLIGDLDLGTTTVTGSVDAPAPMTAVLDATGAAVWARTGVGGGVVALAADGSSAAFGACATGLSIDRLDPTGASTWSLCTRAAGFGDAIAVSPDGAAVFVAGAFSGGHDLTGAPAVDHATYLAELVGGAVTDQRVFGGELEMAGLVPTPDGVVVAVENFGFGTVDFGQGPVGGARDQLILAHVLFASR